MWTIAALAAVIAVAQIPGSVRAAGSQSEQVMVPQSALNSLIGEPDRHFHRAADLYAAGNTDGAASEIRAASALIRMEAGRGNAQDAAKLRTTAADLDNMATSVASGNVDSRQDLDIAFARADLALATHYRSMADKAVADKDRADAARWLKAAGDSVDEAAAWAGSSPSGAHAQVWDRMHALQAKIRTGANWSYDEAKKGVGYLGTQIQYMGQQMKNFGASNAKSGAN